MLTLSQTGKISAALKDVFDILDATFTEVCVEQTLCDPAKDSELIIELEDNARALANFNDELIDLVREYGF